MGGCLPRRGEQETVVFAAASLADALAEIKERYEAGGGSAVVVSFGASQMLAQQIASGAPADIFISAGEHPVAFLDERGLASNAGNWLLTNRLVVAARPAGDIGLTSLAMLGNPAVGRIALADPELAPAGRYGQEALISLGLWDPLEPKLVFGPDVRATLAYVESGNADVALVYATDARAAEDLEVFDIVPADSYSKIRYPMVVVRTSTNETGASEFVAFLEGAEAVSVFKAHGFKPGN